MLPHNIPQDINVELLLSYLKQGSFKVSFKGTHKRNAYNDIIDIEEKTDGTLLVNLGRNSIYNALPEYLFHSIDRFSNLSRLDAKERFDQELEKQEEEKENAYRFFAPLDTQLLLFRVIAREKLSTITETDSILYQILGDTLTEEQLKNRFIKQAIPFLPSCKNIRGNKTLLTLLLRKIFMDEGIKIQVHEIRQEFRDDSPQYIDRLGDSIDETFVGNVYDESVTAFDVYYWPETVDSGFLELVDEIEVFRLFVQDYFMSVEEILRFDIRHDDPALRLSDDKIFNYLNYNTNI